ncbi:MAG: hypothetical protein RQ847_12745, partial [Wenzhouxiangellaceae bacterium]|nr:hypothetical protein [Wenzhouxiangellaceae bacterium]
GTGDEETEGTNIPAPEHAETADEDLARALGDPGPDAAAADADAPDPLPEPPDRTEPGPDSAGRDAVARTGEQSEESADTRPVPDDDNKPPKKSLRRRRRRWR